MDLFVFGPTFYYLYLLPVLYVDTVNKKCFQPQSSGGFEPIALGFQITTPLKH